VNLSDRINNTRPATNPKDRVAKLDCGVKNRIIAKTPPENSILKIPLKILTFK
jgi:hypothetical protein